MQIRWNGETLFPDLDGSVNSPNNNIIVIINSNLSIEGAAEVYSHEANGHSLLYTINGGYREGAIHQPGDMQIKDGNMCFPEGNKILMYIIIHSKRETIYNMKGL